MSFDTLGLSEEILKSIHEYGYTEPTPIQQQAIPVILTGKDMMAIAQTGTGKTAGFTLPLLHLLGSRQVKRAQSTPRALILVPTRELAAQVDASVRKYGKNLRFKSCVVYGGVPIRAQIMDLRKGVDVLVATPGRLLDLVFQERLDLSQVEILVMDEADRILDMGFINDVKKIFEYLPESKQSLLFSATFSKEVKRLADGLLNNPELIQLAGWNTATDTVTQIVHPVDKKAKYELLLSLLHENEWEQVLIFTRTKMGADVLADQLKEADISASSIHGDKSQAVRTRVLSKFKRKNLQILVATDVAARGLDITNLPSVINYDLPYAAEDYVHRIGRTGRAGNTGQAISLVSSDEYKLLQRIQELLEKDIEQVIVPGFEPKQPLESRRSDRRFGRHGRGPSRDGDRRSSFGGRDRHFRDRDDSREERRSSFGGRERNFHERSETREERNDSFGDRKKRFREQDSREERRSFGSRDNKWTEKRSFGNRERSENGNRERSENGNRERFENGNRERFENGNRERFGQDRKPHAKSKKPRFAEI